MHIHISYIIHYIYIYIYILYIYIYIYISDCAARHARACTIPLSAVCCLLSDFLSFKGTFAPGPFFHASLVFPRFLHHFFKAHFFSRISAKRSQNGSPKTTQNSKNPTKKSSSKRTRNQGIQKDSVWKGSNL